MEDLGAGFAMGPGRWQGWRGDSGALLLSYWFDMMSFGRGYVFLWVLAGYSRSIPSPRGHRGGELAMVGFATDRAGQVAVELVGRREAAMQTWKVQAVTMMQACAGGGAPSDAARDGGAGVKPPAWAGRLCSGRLCSGRLWSPGALEGLPVPCGWACHLPRQKPRRAYRRLVGAGEAFLAVRGHAARDRETTDPGVRGGRRGCRAGHRACRRAPGR